MNIFLTYDYELFFGDKTGTAEKCILQPTESLRQMAMKHQIKMIFFIDAGYLKKLTEFKDQFENVQKEYQAILDQIKQLISDGHDCQLHIHPHWEDSYHNGERWVMNTGRYKLSDFSDKEIIRIVLEYQQILFSITGKTVNIYRAGGWCLQPFSRMKAAFERAQLKLDSTVFRGGKFTEGNYFYDFTEAPAKSKWRFSNDLCTEELEGEFLEYPIASFKYSAFFFWRLFFYGRLNPRKHKPIGDGYPMPSPGMRKTMLTRGMLLSASMDGYFVTKLNQILKKNQSARYEDMVVLGHPKACTAFSLEKLNNFIKQQKNNHRFCTFSEILSGQ